MSTRDEAQVLPPDEEYEEPARPASSALPVVLSLVAGLLVVGLMAAIMFSPRAGSGTPGTGNVAPAGAAPDLRAKQERFAVGYLAPDFTLAQVGGGQVQLSSFRGVKPVWVNIWATWCPPCRGEMPEMKKIYAQYKGQGLEILGVDFKESQDQVKQFVSDNQYDWTFLNDFDGAVGIKYQANSIPTHVFVGRDGVIKNIVVGGISQPSMESAVKSLMAP